MPVFASASRATVIDTGSSNRRGMRVTIDEDGRATVDVRGVEPRQVKLGDKMCAQFLRDVNAATPLSDIPARHCMKSASFGSSLYVEVNGERSPDLNCPDQVDPRADALQKGARDILRAAQEASGVSRRRVFSAPIVSPR